MATVPMLAPDGTAGDIPQERVSDAVAAGFKLGTELTAPDGRAGIVPMDRVHDAINAGFTLKGAAPSAMPKPQTQMQTSALGALAPQSVPKTPGAGQTQGDLPGFEGSYASGDQDKGNFMSGAGAVAGAGMLAPAVAPAAMTIATLAAKNPVATAMAIHIARELGVPLPKVLDVLGKFGNPNE